MLSIHCQATVTDPTRGGGVNAWAAAAAGTTKTATSAATERRCRKTNTPSVSRGDLLQILITLEDRPVDRLEDRAVRHQVVDADHNGRVG